MPQIWSEFGQKTKAVQKYLDKFHKSERPPPAARTPQILAEGAVLLKLVKRTKPQSGKRVHIRQYLKNREQEMIGEALRGNVMIHLEKILGQMRRPVTQKTSK